MKRSRSVALTLVAGCAFGLAASPAALAQGTRPKVPTLPSTPQPAPGTSKPGVKAAPKEPDVGPYLVREGSKDWNLVYSVTIHSDRPDQTKEHRDPNNNKTVKMPKVTPFEFETIGVVFPRIPATASSETQDTVPNSSGPNGEGFRGELRLDDRIADVEPTMLKGYPGGSFLGRWDAGERGKKTSVREVQLDVTVPIRAWNVKYDEAGALKVAWPSAWPASAQSALESQLFVEDGVDEHGAVKKYDDAALDQALTAWKKEWKVSDTRSIPPAMLAKMIAAKVWQMVQTNGDGLTFRPRTGELSGIALRPPSDTLTSGRGSEHDLVVLTLALYRKAGLPARLVVAYDAGDKGDRWLDRGSKSSKLRTWIEFCLYDEPNSTINWIPVDIVKLRRSSSRALPVDREWRYFGTHDELDHVLPFAFHFHPPTDVVSYGSPGFWGWFVSPQAPAQAEQAIRVSASSQSKRGGDKEDPKDSRKKRN